MARTSANKRRGGEKCEALSSSNIYFMSRVPSHRVNTLRILHTAHDECVAYLYVRGINKSTPGEPGQPGQPYGFECARGALYSFLAQKRALVLIDRSISIDRDPPTHQCTREHGRLARVAPWAGIPRHAHAARLSLVGSFPQLVSTDGICITTTR